jgi:hypothetical protein
LNFKDPIETLIDLLGVSWRSYMRRASEYAARIAELEAQLSSRSMQV